MRTKTSLLAASTAAVVVVLAVGTPVAAQAGRLLTGQDIKDGTVASADIADGSLRKKDLAPGALPQGPQGPAGPSGVVSTAFRAGSVDTPGPTIGFLIPPATLKVGPDENVFVTSSVSLGSRDGAIDLDLDICYSSGGVVTALPGAGTSDLTAASAQQSLFSLSGLVENLSGTYSFGLCGRSGDGMNWNLQGGGQTTVQVLKTA